MPDLIPFSLEELVYSLATLMDHTIAPLKDHHRRTAIAAFHISAQMDLSPQQRKDLIFAAAIHDIGAFSIEEQQALVDLQFESKYINRHARAAFLLLSEFSYFKGVATILRYHHAYQNLTDEKLRASIPLEAFILQVADHVAVLSDTAINILDKAGDFIVEVENQSGVLFDPKIVAAFKFAASRESFWLDIKNMSLRTLLHDHIQLDKLQINPDEIMGLVNMFRRIIDFRSAFTSTHTAGVGAVAAEMARLLKFDEDTIRKVMIAGYLHDIGKLTVPTEILEKPGFLTHEEFNIIRGHTYFTNEFLSSMALFADIREWAAQHHERLNGRGYPFHAEGAALSTESRILAVADVFTALTEDRPYRKGVPGQEAMIVLNVGVQKREMDPALVSLLGENMDAINLVRIKAQQTAKEEFERFISELKVPGF